MLDGLYRRGPDGEPDFVEVSAPTDEALQAVLHKIITRTMKLLTRRGVLVECSAPPAAVLTGQRRWVSWLKSYRGG